MKVFQCAYAGEILGVDQCFDIRLYCFTTRPELTPSLRWRLRLAWRWLVHRVLDEECEFFFYPEQIPPLAAHLREIAAGATPEPHAGLSVIRPFADDPEDPLRASVSLSLRELPHPRNDRSPSAASVIRRGNTSRRLRSDPN